MDCTVTVVAFSRTPSDPLRGRSRSWEYRTDGRYAVGAVIPCGLSAHRMSTCRPARCQLSRAHSKRASERTPDKYYRPRGGRSNERGRDSALSAEGETAKPPRLAV